MNKRELRVVTVYPRPGYRSQALLEAGALRLPAVLGRSGTTWMKREGDGATPCGILRVLNLIIRPDRPFGRGSRSAPFPQRSMKPDDGWCEISTSGRYNRLVRGAGQSAEFTDRLWRPDRLYDLIGVFDWNICPRIAGRGSAIFLHLTREPEGPTAGCIALAPRHLRLLLHRIGTSTVFFVNTRPGKGRYRR